MSRVEVKTVISVKGVSKTFKTPQGPVTALKDVSLTVSRGEVLGIFGPSGAGKTTLLRCLSLLERPDTGEIWVDGQDILTLSGKTLREVRMNVSVVFQGYNLLYSRNALENVMLPLEIRGIKGETARKKARAFLELVSLGHRERFYPSQMSGGEKQRVAIARALVTDPKVLILDEPTSALDVDTALSILRSVRDINQKYGLTVLIVTHQVDLVGDFCHRAVYLKDGMVTDYPLTCGEGSPNKLRFLPAVGFERE
ncbi:MAG TPA: ATP-binding cassette domain-containing protein [Firmicutes bacterium]|nr:ATP-binding cassette domain-containing protein [Candidatus Fermentithermobacillaceae bacterium]